MMVIPHYHLLNLSGGHKLEPSFSPYRRATYEKLKQKEEEKRYTYALTGFSWAIFHMKKNPRASITVKTPSA